MLHSVGFLETAAFECVYVCVFLWFFITPVNKPLPQFSPTLNSHYRNCHMQDLSEKINQTFHVCVSVLLRSRP